LLPIFLARNAIICTSTIVILPIDFAIFDYQGASAPYPEATLVTLPTSTYTFPPNASQPYTVNTIDTNDVRISGSVSYSRGRMWATINTDNGGRGPGTLA
jgi:hypothetical protein